MLDYFSTVMAFFKTFGFQIYIGPLLLAPALFFAIRDSVSLKWAEKSVSSFEKRYKYTLSVI